MPTPKVLVVDDDETLERVDGHQNKPGADPTLTKEKTAGVIFERVWASPVNESPAQPGRLKIHLTAPTDLLDCKQVNTKH